MAETDYILVESFNRANTQHRLYYAMEESNLQEIKALFGDRVYVLKEGATYYMGNDNNWYAETGNIVL